MEGLSFVIFIASGIGFGATLVMGDLLAAAFALGSLTGWGFVWVAYKENF